VAPNSVVKLCGGRDREWQNIPKKMKEKRVATGKEKKAKGKGAAALPENNLLVHQKPNA